MSSNLETPLNIAAGPPEPDPFSANEFVVWRGLLRVYSRVTRELDRRLLEAHGLGLDAYGVLITLLTAPSGTLTMGELAARHNLSPSGISRSVDRLAGAGLVRSVELVQLHGDGGSGHDAQGDGLELDLPARYR